jgi:5'-3' exonuclease
VDASPYVFRAYFALPDSIRTPEGEPAQAVYGFASFLLKLLADEAPTHLALAFDASLTSSFRNELYPAYKAQRALPPAALEAQLAGCREVAEGLGIACYADERLEADDILGTLAAGLGAAGHGAIVVTHDKDLAQLVGPRVTLYDFAKGERLGPAEVRRKLGVEPAQVPDLLALEGDAVDGIPGVPGIGRKTAVALLAAFGGVGELYARLDEVPGLPLRGAASCARRLAEHREQVFLARRLAEVVRDGPFPADLERLAWRGADREEVGRVFARYGFRTLDERVPRWR